MKQKSNFLFSRKHLVLTDITHSYVAHLLIVGTGNLAEIIIG